MSTLTEKLTDPKFLADLRRIAKLAGEDNAEDCASYIALELLRREAEDPTFGEQKSGYWIYAARWAAQHYAESLACYDKYVACEPMVEGEEGEAESAFDEFISSDSQDPEDIFIVREMLAELQAKIETLTPSQRQVAELLAAHYTPGEIAEEMGASISSVSHITRRMRQSLA